MKTERKNVKEAKYEMEKRSLLDENKWKRMELNEEEAVKVKRNISNMLFYFVSKVPVHLNYKLIPKPYILIKLCRNFYMLVITYLCC